MSSPNKRSHTLVGTSTPTSPGRLQSSGRSCAAVSGSCRGTAPKAHTRLGKCSPDPRQPLVPRLAYLPGQAEVRLLVGEHGDPGREDYIVHSHLSELLKDAAGVHELVDRGGDPLPTPLHPVPASLPVQKGLPGAFARQLPDHHVGVHVYRVQHGPFLPTRPCAEDLPPSGHLTRRRPRG